MTCDDVLKALEAGPIGAAAREHAEGCAPCAALLSALDLAASDEDALVEPPPPGYWASFDARLRARLAAVPAPRRRWRRVALAAAAGVGLTVLGLGLLLRDRTPPAIAADPAGEAATDLDGPWLAAADEAWVEAGLAEALPSSAEPTLAPVEAWVLDPVGATAADLSGLDDDAAAELARRLREEMSS